MVDFLRSVERFSRLIRMYLDFSLMFIALTTMMDPPRKDKCLGKLMSDKNYSSKGLKSL